MSTALIIHNIGYIIDSGLLVFLILLIFIKNKRSLANITFALSLVAVLVFTVSHVMGVNTIDPQTSRDILMFNLSIIFVSCFLAHSVLILIGKAKQQRPAIVTIYAISIALFAFYLISPDSFLVVSHAKLYFPNYYVAGNLHWIMRLVSNILIPLYFLIQMGLAYRTGDSIMKNRIKYLFVAIALGYSLGWLAIVLVFFDYPTLFGFVVDPVYSIFFVPLFGITFTYTALKYQLMDIKIIAKQAFIYAIITSSIGIFITIFNLFSEIIQNQYPLFPDWLLPMISSIIAVSIGAIVWKKLRESDMLKYEFITVVTHKFRGPLTQISWISESLLPTVSAEVRDQIQQIRNANQRLLEMTNTLVRVSDSDNSEYSYQRKPIRLGKIVYETIPEYRDRAALKGISMKYSDDSILALPLDETKIKFVIQILLDNAVNYTPSNGSISVDTKDSPNGKSVILRVTDTGIGIAKDEQNKIFQKFWRSGAATRADINGMGIGLFIARNIVDRHGGKMWAVSEGLNRGTTFFVQLSK